MHVFLTSNPYVGIKTAVETITDGYAKEEIGGFVSYFGLDDLRDIKSLYMCAANSEMLCDDEHAVAYFYASGLFNSLTERFDSNAKLLTELPEGVKLIVMNECSYLESGAEVFKKAVMDCLDGDIPVLGVFKTKNNTWTQRIATHPKVKVINIKETPREELIGMIREALNRQPD